MEVARDLASVGEAHWGVEDELEGGSGCVMGLVFGCGRFLKGFIELHQLKRGAVVLGPLFSFWNDTDARGEGAFEGGSQEELFLSGVFSN